MSLWRLRGALVGLFCPVLFILSVLIWVLFWRTRLQAFQLWRSGYLGTLLEIVPLRIASRAGYGLALKRVALCRPLCPMLSLQGSSVVLQQSVC